MSPMLLRRNKKTDAEPVVDIDTVEEIEDVKDTEGAEGTEDTTETEDIDDAEDIKAADLEQHASRWRRVNWSRTVAYGLLPALALVLTGVVGVLDWRDNATRNAAATDTDAVRAAADGTIALLSYKPNTVQADLEAARNRLTGAFLQAYTTLTRDVVIPGAQQKQISAVATVPAAAPTLVTPDHAVVLLFVNQNVVVGQDAPASTASSVRVTLDKIDGRWLISKFDPV